jgi:isoquinoline 1-oxidoreductase alpha subunit
MARFTLLVNGVSHSVDVAPETSLLWVLRDSLGLNGTKYGCGMSLCGACTVHVDGEAMRSCVMSVESIGDRRLTTIEGLSKDRTHPLQEAWIAEQVPQCGYCQSGVLMAAALKSAITISRGRVEQSNFGDFDVLRIDAMPVVEVHFVPSTLPPTGIGEPGLPPLAPAVANAVYAACGKRLRRLPTRPEDLGA